MANWHVIDDSQTPLIAGGFQKNAFQHCFEHDVFQLPFWLAINDAQAGDAYSGFQAGVFQLNEFENYTVSSWSLIDDTQTPLIINGAFQKGPFQKCFEQGISQLPIWVQVNDSQ